VSPWETVGAGLCQSLGLTPFTHFFRGEAKAQRRDGWLLLRSRHDGAGLRAFGRVAAREGFSRHRLCGTAGWVQGSPLAFHQAQTVFACEKRKEEINNPQIRMLNQSVEIGFIRSLPKRNLQRATTEQAHQRADRPSN
jgi:hypothetical protein